MSTYDYIVVGAGSAGCVLANRLSVGDASVLLIEAGGSDRSPAIQIPKGLKFALGNRKLSWGYETLPFGPEGQTEAWPRGKTLGGSSAVNGLVWNRGHAADFDAIEALGNPGWGWSTILPIYRAMEDHQLGASDMRGAGGPVRISISTDPVALCEEAIASAGAMGLARLDDVNSSDEERIGYTPGNIDVGRRVSAAKAFLHPIRDRANLEVATHALAVGLLFDGDRAVGVRTRQRGGRVVDYRAAGEVILSLGTIGTPQLLELSGIGAASVLQAAGIATRVESPNVGERMREHRAVSMQWRLREPLGYNPMLKTPLHQGLVGARYLATRRGILGLPAYDLLAFCKSRPDADRPDGMFLFAPLSLRKDRPILQGVPEKLPGVSCAGAILRPDSEGSVHVRSSDPDGPPAIDPGYLRSEHDRRVTAGLMRKLRELVSDGPLAPRIESETFPGPAFESDEQLADVILTKGNTGYHAVGACAMGPGDDHVVDPQLRVRGIEGLRVVDNSVFPLMPSGNTNAPVMALAWHAADIILGDVPAAVGEHA